MAGYGRTGSPRGACMVKVVHVHVELGAWSLCSLKHDDRRLRRTTAPHLSRDTTLPTSHCLTTPTARLHAWR